MTRREELIEVDSCFNRASNDEMLFVLLARDPAAPVAIKAWIEERLRLGKNKNDDDQIENARRCIITMIKHQLKLEKTK